MNLRMIGAALAAFLLLGLATTARAASVPTLSTILPSGITGSGATLKGNLIDDGGSAITDRGFVICEDPCTPAVGATGSVSYTVGAGGLGTFSRAVPLHPSAGYNFRAWATNGVGHAYGGTASFRTPANAAPAADAGGPYTIDEGSALHLDGSGSSDADGDALTYTWDVDGNGTFGDATGAQPTLTWAQLSALGLDGPADRTVHVRVSDGTNPAVTATATLHVDDVAPTATFNAPATAAEGTTIALSASGATDASPADAAGLRYAFDTDGNGTWDVGNGTYAGGVTSATTSFTAPDGPATRTVKLRVIDRDGGFTDSTKQIAIANADPTATLSADGPVDEGSPARVRFTGASDASAGDTAAGFHYAFDTDGDGSYDIGDGTYLHTPPDASAVVPTSDDGTTTVTAAIIDRDGGITRRTVEVVARNVAPEAAIEAPAATPLDTPLGFRLSAADPSGADTAAGFAYAVDWGDGSSGSGDTHTYTAPGTYTVSVTATDKDGATGRPAKLDVTIPARAAATPPPPSPPSAPVAQLSNLRAQPRCSRTAAALRYTLNVAASVRVTIARDPVRSSFRTCPASKPPKRHKPGTYKRVRTIVAAGRAGANALPPVTKLRPGTYLATVEALDASGRVVSRAQVKLWILRGSARVRRPAQA